MTTSRSPLGLVLVCLGVGACGEADGGPPTVSVRDSAGVMIVENREVAGRTAAWTIDPDPVFQFGWSAGDPEFQRVFYGAFGSDGRTIVADAGANLVYAFTTTDDSWTLVGSEGEGPGEFTGIQSVLALGADSFLVADRGNARATIYAGTDPVREQRFEAFQAGAIYGPIGRSGEWFVLAPRGFPAGLESEPGWVSYPILRSRDLGRGDTLALVAAYASQGAEDWNPVRHFGGIAFAGGLVAHGTTDSPELVWYDVEGARVLVTRWDSKPRPADDDDWARYEEGNRLRGGGRDPEVLNRDLQRRREAFGGVMPLYRWLLGDSAGNLWLSEFDFVDIWPARYAIVQADGVWLGTVEFPRPIRILDISDTHVLGVETDELDVEAVTLYRIRKPGGTGGPD